MKKIFTLIMIIGYLISTSYSQGIDFSKWQVYTAANNFRAICKVNNRLWVGHDGGISILTLEGEVLDYITKANSGLPTNIITHICVDSNNVVWIGTPEGLVKYDGENWEQYYNKNSPLQSNRITALNIDKESKVWVGTEKNYQTNVNLFYIENGNWKSFDQSIIGGGGIGSPINVLVSNNNKVWIGYSTKLFERINDSQFVSHDVSLVMTGTMPEINNYYMDKEDDIWIAANGPAAEYTSEGNWNIWDESNSPFYDKQKKIFVDMSNKPWVGTSDNGIYRLEENDWVKYEDNKIGINSNILNTFYNSSPDSYYFGSNKNFYKYNGIKWNELNLSNSGLISPNFIKGIETSETEMIYITNNNSLLSMNLNNNQWDTLLTINGELKKIVFDKNDNLLITTYDDGLVKYNISSKQSYIFNKENSALKTNRINIIEVEENGKVWIGTHGSGVYLVNEIDDLLKPDKVINYTTQNSPLPHNAVLSIEKNELTDEVWFGCDWYGWAKFDGVTWVTFTTDNTPFTNPQIKDIVSDNNGRVWAGSNSELCSYSNGEWNLELNNSVNALETDDSGNIWVGAKQHLFKIKNSELIDYNSRIYPFPDNIMELKVDKANNLWIGGTGFAVLFSDSTSTFVENPSANYLDFHLSQNYPNPFNPTTRIKYTIPQNTHPSIPSREGKESSDRLARHLLGGGVLVTLKVYDILGKEVATLVNKEQSVGSYEVEFQANELPSGVYFYRLQTGSFVETKKILLLR